MYIEEPESHLSVNNFNLVTDFIQKNIDDENTLTQVILTSHNPKIINKLKLSNIVAISGEKTLTSTMSSQILLIIWRKDRTSTY